MDPIVAQQTCRPGDRIDWRAIVLTTTLADESDSKPVCQAVGNPSISIITACYCQ